MDFDSGMSNKLKIKLKVKKPTCSLCGKSFPSQKSLYGHMRCHPDRYYRGMQPPDAFKFATRSTDQPLMAVDDNNNNNNNNIDCMDLLRSLPGWSVKAKRNSIVEKGAVYALMLMATGDESYRYLDNDGKIEDEDKAQKSSVNNTADSDRKGETAKVMDSELSDQQINNPADAAAVPKCYKCSICDKTFATHQALGGHKSSAHYKHQFDHQQGNHDAFVSSQPPLSVPDTIVSEELGHICKTCNKAFPSGQALGGHMRRHWAGPSPPSSSSSMASLPVQVQLPMTRSDGLDHSGSSTATAEITRPVLDLDLNQFPAGNTDDVGISIAETTRPI